MKPEQAIIQTIKETITQNVGRRVRTEAKQVRRNIPGKSALRRAERNGTTASISGKRSFKCQHPERITIEAHVCVNCKAEIWRREVRYKR